jgi:hypothetical protein
MAFASASDLVLQYSAKRVGELAGDGTLIAEGDLDGNAVIEWALERATEEILMSVRRGDKYEEEDLQDLADSATSGWALRGLTVDLAFGLLQLRKGVRASDMSQLCPGFVMAQQTLKLLSDGEEIFPRITGEEHPDAGTPRTANLLTQTTSPEPGCSWSQTANIRLLPFSPTTDPNGCC